MTSILLCRKLSSPWSNYTSEFLLDFVINSSPNEGTFYLCIGIYVNIEIVDPLLDLLVMDNLRPSYMKLIHMEANTNTVPEDIIQIQHQTAS